MYPSLSRLHILSQASDFPRAIASSSFKPDRDAIIIGMMWDLNMFESNQKAIEERSERRRPWPRMRRRGHRSAAIPATGPIGMGSFGLVYNATVAQSRRKVDAKICNIEEDDSIRPGAADTFGDI
jgi:hypothetical protein